ncbi:head GIN domain-containing protein [Hymenobacter metallicola]|uniref:DUF2807 domain-containing protein n=1 Tax=Hymenobacter metallicola TaxID=2563114 RepID=A0A4Z0QAY5_9BACT|nr:head GIN domain-containing protein [Hymenobacter metallicola]TGE26231.1 DUF2807 domain-containing protein [Hymenobacter metallicola]
MKTFATLCLLPLSLLLGGCDCNDIFPDKVTGSGPVVTENRTVPGFSRLELAVDADVYLTQGATRTVRVEAQQNILDVLQTNVSGERLSIGYGRVNVRNHEPIKVFIQTPALSNVAVSGSGKVVGQNAWRADDLGLSLSGSGGIDLSVVGAQNLRTDISGSGAVRLAGDARRHEVHISGSGSVDAYPLTVQAAEVHISGSGSTYLTATQTLTASISGSGKVYYKGRPSVTVRTSGSGRVVDAN